jgi:hypothetical protein
MPQSLYYKKISSSTHCTGSGWTPRVVCGWFGKNLVPLWGVEPHFFCCPDHTLVVMVTDFPLFKENFYDNICSIKAQLQHSDISVLML